MNDCEKIYDTIDTLMDINLDHISSEHKREKIEYTINDIVIELEDLAEQLKDQNEE